MRILVNGSHTFVATGGKDFDSSLPAIVFLHGAGMDHSVWALLARAFAHHGYAVLAPDLPGHGRSAGKPLTSIAALADWTAALIDVAGAKAARLVGHSMGSLVALETAARHPDKVTGLGLIATTATMRVSDDLLNAARANDHDAVDMIAIWGEGYRASLGGSQAPGLWMLGGAERLLERAQPGAIFADLSACNAYQDALSTAAKITVPSIVIQGSRDLMTPAKGGKALAAAIPNCRLALIEGAGHMLMSERPDDVLAALRN
ncbi:MAG TPA: alpha/beta hydrolase [Xanthobacteraceae bacterium]|jgi:pimeloyl-ACP methyl ester carboxylesterase|nr:alpha/beta hydrolase [Xanthobacteraceae bacterium]